MTPKTAPCLRYIGVFGIMDLLGKIIMKNIAIKENHLYNKAYTRGKSFTGRLVAVYVLKDRAALKLKNANPQKQFVNRFGLSVSKKLGGAVVRNRAKRIIRAGLDTCKAELRQGYLIVISARFGIRGRSSADVAKELRNAFENLDLLINEDKS